MTYVTEKLHRYHIQVCCASLSISAPSRPCLCGQCLKMNFKECCAMVNNRLSKIKKKSNVKLQAFDRPQEYLSRKTASHNAICWASYVNLPWAEPEPTVPTHHWENAGKASLEPGIWGGGERNICIPECFVTKKLTGRNRILKFAQAKNNDTDGVNKLSTDSSVFILIKLQNGPSQLASGLPSRER